jgi:hypothetical protein
MTRQLITDDVFLSPVRAAADGGNTAAQQLVSLLSPGGARPMLRPTLVPCTRYKRFLTDQAGAADFRMHPGLLDLYLTMPMPHHVWVVEVTSANLWGDGSQVLGEVILDATGHPVHSVPYGTGFVAVHMPGSLFTRDAAAWDPADRQASHRTLDGDDVPYASCFAVEM